MANNGLELHELQVVETDVHHEEIKRLVLGANQEDCYLDRLNDSLESFHKQLLEMQVNAANGCQWW
jgi:hypothetical protein